jgi:hypothetical protein
VLSGKPAAIATEPDDGWADEPAAIRAAAESASTSAITIAPLRAREECHFLRESIPRPTSKPLIHRRCQTATGPHGGAELPATRAREALTATGTETRGNAKAGRLVSSAHAADSHQLVTAPRELLALRRADLEALARLEPRPIVLGVDMTLWNCHLPPLEVRQPSTRQPASAGAGWIEPERRHGSKITPRRPGFRALRDRPTAAQTASEFESESS